MKEVDPEGRDPAPRRMVLIGHSQGGLLARLMVSESASCFWDSASSVPPMTRKMASHAGAGAALAA